MKKVYFCLTYCLITILLAPLGVVAQEHMHPKKEVSFTENKGQWGEDPYYRAEFHGGYAYLENGKITYVVQDMDEMHKFFEHKHHPQKFKNNKNSLNPNISHHAYRVNFLNSNPDARILPSDKAPDYANFYLSDDPSRWAGHAKKYHTVNYQDFYPGIDLEFHRNASHLKYTFTLEAGVDPEVIKAKYKGINRLDLENGDLILKTSVQDVVELKPYAFQIIEGDTVEVNCRYKITDDQVSYEFPQGYSQDHKLYIDPTLVFSTFSGSVSDNWGYTATYDSEGNAFGGGIVFGSGYPTTLGAYDVNFSGGGIDIVLTKIDTSGSNLLYSTYLGGGGADVPHSLICNSYDQLILLGTSGSQDFPTTNNVINPNFSGGSNVSFINSMIQFSFGSDIILSKFSKDGTSLMASSYVGGSGNDGLNASNDLSYNYADEFRGEVMVDENDNIYVASTTSSTDFPMAGNGFQQSNNGKQDAIIFKTTTYIDGLIWSTYLGGNGDDAAYNILVTDKSAEVYIAGGTSSSNFPTTMGSYDQTNNGGQADGFISYLDTKGDKLLASTYYGSSAYDQIYFVEQDLDGAIYVLGQTAASGVQFVDNAQWSQPGGGQFVSKFGNMLASRTWSTAFGDPSNSGPDISPTTFMVDYCSSIYIAGWGGGLNGFGGTSGLPVTSNAMQPTTDNDDYYFMVLDKNVKDLQYATFFGGSQNVGEHVDGGTSRFSKKGAIYQAICSGCGGFSDLPTTPNAWSTVNNSQNCNLAVVKLKFDVKAVIADYKKPYSGCVPYTVTFENRSYSSGNNTYYLWDFGDGDTSMQYQPTHTYTQTGFFTITLKVVDSTSCNIADSLKYSILVLDDENDTLPPVEVCKGDSVEIGIAPHNLPNVIYNWHPFKRPGPMPCPPNCYMPVDNIDESRTKVLTEKDTTFYLKINNGICTDSIVQFVDVIDIEANAGPDKLLCDSMVTLQGKGSGDDTLIYVWSENGTFTDTLNKDIYDGKLKDYKLKTPTDLYLKVTNGNCEDIDTVAIDYKINLTDSTQTPTCHGDCDGYISVDASGGMPPYDYYWSNGMTGKNISNLCGGGYSVTVYDADSCLMTKKIDLFEPQPLLGNVHKQNAPCEEVCIGEAQSSTMGGTPPYNYQWSDGQTTKTAVDLCVGKYQLTITDAHGCVTTDSIEIKDLSQNVDFEAFAGADTIYQGQKTSVYTKDTAGYTYLWEPGSGLEDPTADSTTASPQSTTTYILTVKDQYGCVFKDTVTIHVKPVTCDEPYIFVPNAFTPDGDGKNDILYVRSQYAEEVWFAVYNRWGEKVFETNDINRGWDGTINGKKAEPGVYVYRLHVLCFTQEVFEKSGNVTLIR